MYQNVWLVGHDKKEIRGPNTESFRPQAGDYVEIDGQQYYVQKIKFKYEHFFSDEITTVYIFLEYWIL